MYIKESSSDKRHSINFFSLCLFLCFVSLVLLHDGHSTSHYVLCLIFCIFLSFSFLLFPYFIFYLSFSIFFCLTFYLSFNKLLPFVSFCEFNCCMNISSAVCLSFHLTIRLFIYLPTQRVSVPVCLSVTLTDNLCMYFSL